jgi:alanine-synthesizing transaminase
VLRPIPHNERLADVRYDIRGPLHARALDLEQQGKSIIRLNIGNPGRFGFEAPAHVREAIATHLKDSEAYCHQGGLTEAREAIAEVMHARGVREVDQTHVFVGNGVSELIDMALRGLLNPGDEVLVPAPDYPLWTAAVSLSGGTPRHYLCDESAGWLPDLDDIRAKITPNTRAIVIINPNNPTGALYPDSLLREIVAIAREHGLIIYADEVYDKVLYDGVTHTAIASLSEDVLTVTFNGLSKNYRSCGYRAGWMVVSGDKREAGDYIEGLNMLASMRLCANVPGQYAIQTALGGYQSIDDLVAEGGRMRRQRDLAHQLITAIPGVTCVKPKATLYMFPRLDPAVYPIADDQAFIAELLEAERVLLVQGTGFNWPHPDHFRLVFLPHEDDLREAIGRIARFLEGYRKRHGTA